MKVRSEDILKPGAVLKVEKINFSDPSVVKFLEDRRPKRKLLHMRVDRLRTIYKVITI